MEVLGLDEIMLKNGLKTEPGQSPLLTKFSRVARGWAQPEVREGTQRYRASSPTPAFGRGVWGWGWKGSDQDKDAVLQDPSA